MSTKRFTFTGQSLDVLGEYAVLDNLEDFYQQIRARGYVPIQGTEDLDMQHKDEYRNVWTLNVIGKKHDTPGLVRYLTTEGEEVWFTPSSTSETSFKELALR